MSAPDPSQSRNAVVGASTYLSNPPALNTHAGYITRNKMPRGVLDTRSALLD
jgi:hypothetical protein